MKTNFLKAVLLCSFLISINSCKKSGEYEEASANISAADAKVAIEEVSDSISLAATQEVEGKKFIKNAEVNMEVKDVYDATISIEKALRELSGFVTSSQMHSQVLEEDSYNTSDTDAVLVRKYQMENSMQVRVPTVNLGVFLDKINDKKLFLNTRIISAEDVSSSIKFAELEGKRIKKTQENVSTVKNGLDKVNKSDSVMMESNQHQLASLEMTDNLKYSTVNIYIKEPKTSVSTLAITNTKNVDNQYKMNFFYEMKNAFVEGFYLIQLVLIGIMKIWPLLLVGVAGFLLWRRRKVVIKPVKSTEDNAN